MGQRGLPAWRQDPSGEQGAWDVPHHPFSSATGCTFTLSSDSSTCSLPECSPLPSAKGNGMICRGLLPRLSPSPSSQIYSFITSRHKKFFLFLAEIAACSRQPLSSSGGFYTTEDRGVGRGGRRRRSIAASVGLDGDCRASLLPARPCGRCYGSGGPDSSWGVPSAMGTGRRLAGTCSSSQKAAVEPSPHYFENPSCMHAIYSSFDFSAFSPVFTFLLLGFHPRSLCLSLSPSPARPSRDHPGPLPHI